MNTLPDIPATKPFIHPRPLTAREVKNKILASMDDSERSDAIVGDTVRGGYLILTDRRVIEIYESAGELYAQEAQLDGSGFESVSY